MKKPLSPRKRLKIRKESKTQAKNTALVNKDFNFGTDFELEKNKRLKLPSTKYSHREIAGKITHHFLSFALPIAVYILVAVFHIWWLALVLILLSKWQIFVVKPRFWWANIKYSAVDLIFKLSILSLMIQSQVKIDQLINKNALALHILQIVLVGVYIVWNIYLRKRSQTKDMLHQALAAQFLGLTSIAWLAGFSTSAVPLPALIALSWVVAYSSAQHAMYAYEEAAIPQLASFWALFATLLSFLQMIWAQNFLFFSGLIYTPMMPLIISLFSYLAWRTHDYIELEQDNEEIPKARQNKRRESIIRQAGFACVISLILAILIATF